MMYQRVTNYKQFISSALLTVMLLFAQTLYAVHSPQTFYEHDHHHHELDDSYNHINDHNASSSNHTHHTQTSAQHSEYNSVIRPITSAVELPYSFSSILVIHTPPKRPPKA